jgi:hypothetical protein
VSDNAEAQEEAPPGPWSASFAGLRRNRSHWATRALVGGALAAGVGALGFRTWGGPGAGAALPALALWVASGLPARRLELQEDAALGPAAAVPVTLLPAILATTALVGLVTLGLTGLLWTSRTSVGTEDAKVALAILSLCAAMAGGVAWTVAVSELLLARRGVPASAGFGLSVAPGLLLRFALHLALLRFVRGHVTPGHERDHLLPTLVFAWFGGNLAALLGLALALPFRLLLPEAPGVAAAMVLGSAAALLFFELAAGVWTARYDAWVQQRGG